MRRVGGLLVVLAGLLLVGASLSSSDSGGSGATRDRACAEVDESSFTAESLHDLRSFSDAMAVVKAVGEEVPPAPEGPEGWAGFIGRVVTVRVERVLWRRPKAPEPPRSFRFSDWGWFGTLENRKPARVCGVTRMELGRRYLAPVARLRNGTWYPFDEVRLRIDGRRVVGGVDGGEPTNAHNALAGRSIRGAVRMVARTHPYRAGVRHPRLDPARRWQLVDRDRYRVWRARPGMSFVVRSGVTPRARWELYFRLPRRGGMCVGIAARRLWGGGSGAGGEGCGPRRIATGAVTVGTFAATRLGLFALGRAGERVAAVRVRFPGERARELPTYPTPIPPGGRGRFWVAPARAGCPPRAVPALDVEGRVVSERRVPETDRCFRSDSGASHAGP
jgi:hypothetical protein